MINNTISFYKKSNLLISTVILETEKAVKVSVSSCGGGMNYNSGNKNIGSAWIPKSVLVKRFENIYDVKQSFENNIKILK